MHSQLLPTNTTAAPSGNEDDGLLAAGKSREDSLQKINLDLGIGTWASANGGLGSEKITKHEERERPFFTAAQFHEFYNQILVCNYIVCGLPLPFHLFLPIWTTVVRDTLDPAIFKKYPSFIGLYPQRSGHTRMMDSEPGRCKRTDGRKWRCSKSVVPHQKYCDRHMYRGRRGSRKHCQPIESVSRSVSKISSVTSGVDNRIAISIRNDLDGGNCNEGKGSSFVNSDPRKITKRKNTVAKTNYLGFVSPGFGFSPNSVLHSDAGKVNLGSDSKELIEASPQRCLRTDGKKWQCRRDVVPDQKYCEAHMHRGAKRLVLNPESMRNLPGTSTRRPHISRTIAASPDKGINLNTMPSSPQQHVTENNSTSSSTSDATTITDENIGFCLKPFSPSC